MADVKLSSILGAGAPVGGGAYLGSDSPIITLEGKTYLKSGNVTAVANVPTLPTSMHMEAVGGWAASTGTMGVVNDIDSDGAGVWCAATSNGIWRSTDDAASWTGPIGATGGTTFQCIASNRAGGAATVWHAGTSTGPIWRSVDNGTTFSSTAVSSYAVNAVSTDRAGVWVAVSSTNGTDQATCRLTSNTGAWGAPTAITGSSGGVAAIRGIATNRAGKWVIGINSTVAHTSSDNGVSFTQQTGLSAAANDVTYVEGTTSTFVLGTSTGVIRTTDLTSFSSTTVSGVAGGIYALTSSSGTLFGMSQQRVHRSIDAGIIWCDAIINTTIASNTDYAAEYAAGTWVVAGGTAAGQMRTNTKVVGFPIAVSGLYMRTS